MEASVDKKGDKKCKVWREFLAIMGHLLLQDPQNGTECNLLHKAHDKLFVHEHLYPFIISLCVYIHLEHTKTPFCLGTAEDRWFIFITL